jgi:hypothetical protein
MGKNTDVGLIVGVGGSKESKCVQVYVFILQSLSQDVLRYGKFCIKSITV